MSKNFAFFKLRAKALFLSWILQIVFALWVALCFAVFAKIDHAGSRDASALALIVAEDDAATDGGNVADATPASLRLPPPLFAPVEP